MGINTEDRHQTPSELIEDLNRVERGEVPLKRHKPRKSRKGPSPVALVAMIGITALLVAGGTLAALRYRDAHRAGNVAGLVREAVTQARYKADEERLAAERTTKAVDDRLARLTTALVAARAAKATGQWQTCADKSADALAIAPGHAEATALKREAEGQLKPTLTVTATADGREVAAMLATGGQIWTTPTTLTLKEGQRYSFTISMKSNQSTPSISSKRYQPVTLALTADWRGPRTERVRLEEQKEPNPGEDLTVELASGVPLVLCWCPAGSFMMGSPSTETDRYDGETQHRVTLTKGFWMGKYEVTQGQWEAVMGSNPSHFKAAGKNAPVEQVSWDDCQAFVRKLNTRVPGGGFRLPTEAEWEYACRAGTTTAFHYGNDLDATMANFNGLYPYDNGRQGKYRKTTVSVGSFRPNDWGLYDMHGNVCEWCQDWYEAYPSGSVSDPIGPGSGSRRVLRGGGWYDHARGCRSALRDGIAPGIPIQDLGLRLARNPQ